MSTAGVLIIGNEILSGKVVDTNSPFLATELRALGVDLDRILTIADEVDLIASEVRVMSDAYDYVFTSGGIGPTHDDLTMEGVARAFGREVVLHEGICARIQRAQNGKPLNESQKKMAQIPAGAQMIDAGDLWFPVIIVENVHVFPGIPKLLRKKFRAIRDRFAGVPFKLTRVYVKPFESDIADKLDALLGEFSDLMLGSYPRLGESEYRVMLTLESRDGAYLERALESLLGRLSPEDVHKVE
jgi:molybdenum cofactor synthesis domain-containing protein